MFRTNGPAVCCSSLANGRAVGPYVVFLAGNPGVPPGLGKPLGLCPEIEDVGLATKATYKFWFKPDALVSPRSSR